MHLHSLFIFYDFFLVTFLVFDLIVLGFGLFFCSLLKLSIVFFTSLLACSYISPVALITSSLASLASFLTLFLAKKCSILKIILKKLRIMAFLRKFNFSFSVQIQCIQNKVKIIKFQKM